MSYDQMGKSENDLGYPSFIPFFKKFRRIKMIHSLPVSLKK